MFVTETVRILSTLFFYQHPQLWSPAWRLFPACVLAWWRLPEADPCGEMGFVTAERSDSLIERSNGDRVGQPLLS